MSKLKILHVVPTISNLSAGTTDVVLSLCEAQNNEGAEVTLFVLGKIPDNINVGFNIRSFPRCRFPNFSYGRSPEMKKALAETIPTVDIVHTHMLWMAPCIYAGLLSKKFNKIHICSPHGALTKYSVSRSWWKKKLVLFTGQEKSLKSVTKFHLTSEMELDDLKSMRWFKSSFIIPNGINGPSPSNSFVKNNSMLFLSRIHPKKGLKELLTSFSNVTKKNKNWKLKIIGPIEDFEYFNSFKDLIDNNLRVEYLGEVTGPSKFKIMSEAKLFILPTYSENFGLVVGESLMCETPVICTKGAPWEILNENESGWWVDLSDLEKTINKAILLSDDKLLSMGRNGKKYVEDNYSWSKLSLRFLEQYNKCLETL